MSRLSQSARTAATLAVLALLLVLGAVWGWSAATAPIPDTPAPPPCVPVDIKAGERVYPDQVLVSVLNAGGREGLAGRTMRLLVDEGFVAGNSGNAPKDAKVARAQVWAPTDDPAAQLVASWLGKGVRIVERDGGGALGVVVVVGDQFTDLTKGRKSVAARVDTTICSPPDAVR